MDLLLFPFRILAFVLLLGAGVFFGLFRFLLGLTLFGLASVLFLALLGGMIFAGAPLLFGVALFVLGVFIGSRQRRARP